MMTLSLSRLFRDFLLDVGNSSFNLFDYSMIPSVPAFGVNDYGEFFCFPFWAETIKV